jgi:hypothetical protein
MSSGWPIGVVCVRGEGGEVWLLGGGMQAGLHGGTRQGHAGLHASKEPGAQQQLDCSTQLQKCCGWWGVGQSILLCR